MFTSEDIRLKGSIPFLKGKTVILVENPAKPITIADANYWRELKEQFGRHGYNFIILPDLLSEIASEMSEYVFPGYEAPELAATYEHITDVAGIGNHNGFLYKIGRESYFKDITDPYSNVREVVFDLIDKFQESSKPKEKKTGDSGPRFSIKVDPSQKELYEHESIYDSLPMPTGAPISYRREEQVELDEKTEKVLADVKSLLKTYNLSLDELREILGYRVKLSRMRITRDGRILLMDFIDKETGLPKEVKMFPLTKMLYLFYLKHPEGVRIKEVNEHIFELMHLYMGITGRDDMEAIRASILKYVDPYGNDINVSMSRIKAAFNNVIDESVAKYYWVIGNGGSPYRIVIDRDKVLWEYGG